MGMRVRVWLLLWAPLQHTLAIYVVVIVFFRCIENDNEGHVCGCVCDVRYRANWHRDTPGHLPPTPRQRVNGLGTGERGCSVLLAERAALPFVLRWKMMYNVLFLGAVESKYIYKYNIYNVYYHNRTTRTPPPPATSFFRRRTAVCGGGEGRHICRPVGLHFLTSASRYIHRGRPLFALVEKRTHTLISSHPVTSVVRSDGRRVTAGCSDETPLPGGWG